MKKLLGLFLLTAAILTLTVYRRPSAAAALTFDWPTESIEPGTLMETVSATGTIQPANIVPVGGDSVGRVMRVFVEPGQVVPAGTALAQLDDRLAQLRVQQAKLGVELAQAEVQRAEAGRDAAQLNAKRAREPAQQLNPARDVEGADLQLRVAEAALKAAQLKIREAQTGQQLAEQAVEMTIIRAPISGIVLDKRIVVGQQVGSPLSAQMFTLAPDLEHLQITALVAEGDVGKLRAGLNTQFTVNAWPDHPFEGRVNRIGQVPVTVQGAVQYPVFVDALNTKESTGREWRLRPGMSASVDVVIRRHERIWKLPIVAASINIDDAKLNDLAKRKLARWKSRGDRSEYQRVWTLNADGAPWPLFLRTAGRDDRGEPGINDGKWVEVLAWDPDETAPAKPIRVITAIPDSLKPTKPGLKLF